MRGQEQRGSCPTLNKNGRGGPPWPPQFPAGSMAATEGRPSRLGRPEARHRFEWNKTMSTLGDFDVAIAGAGPAGSSAAIHLAMKGARVLLIEQKIFPRPKLCGEFISPECLDHFERLGVADEMLAAGGAAITQTVFYSPKGRSLTVPSEWFGNNLRALGLSRAEMDQRLLARAKSLGVIVLEDTLAADVVRMDEVVRGVLVKSKNRTGLYNALVSIDATGRKRALARRIERGRNDESHRRPRLIAFKSHLKGARPAEGACEIYSYHGGYGGLSRVEGGLSNFCFIALARDVRRFGSDPEALMRGVVFRNPRAAETLACIESFGDWLSVSIERFGRHKLVPVKGLMTIGDAAAFIDPFTGSGMLMALESGEVAARAILGHLEKLRKDGPSESLAADYRQRYAERFNSRLRICDLLRRVAFVPWLAEAAITCFGASARLRRKIASATRPSLDGDQAHGFLK